MFQSRKFQYAVATLLAALIVTMLPSILPGLDKETIDLLKDVLPGIVAVGIAVIGGHSITDLVATWANRPQFKEISEALQYVVDLALQDENVLNELSDLLQEAGVKVE